MATGQRFVSPVQAEYDELGVPLVGAKLWFYENGTTTPKNTYADYSLSVANTGAMSADAAGRFLDNIFLSGSYRVKLTATVNGVPDAQVWQVDDVNVVEAALPVVSAQKGDVLYFFGSASDLSAKTALGWKIADGTSGTPDIIGTNNFLRSTGSVSAIGNTGGFLNITPTGVADSHVLTVDEIPSHNHAPDAAHTLLINGAGYTSGFQGGTPGQDGSSIVSVGGDQGHGHTLTIDSHSNLPPYYDLLVLIYGY